MGILEVKLVQAHGLTNKDLIGKSDPFAKLYIRPLRSKMKTSKVIVSFLINLFIIPLFFFSKEQIRTCFLLFRIMI